MRVAVSFVNSFSSTVATIVNPSLAALVVDDDMDVRALVHDSLSTAGFQVATATSYHEARQLLATVRPTVLITAVRLGAFNGLQLVLLHSFATEGVDVVIDAENDRITAAEAQRLGAVYLAKPVSAHQLLDAINTRLAARDAAPTPAEQRRWIRTRLRVGVPVAIENLRAVLTEVGYGGFRVELSDADAQIPPRFTLRAQGLSAPICATRAWERRYDQPMALHCGASLEKEDSESQARWRRCVDEWQTRAP